MKKIILGLALIAACASCKKEKVTKPQLECGYIIATIDTENYNQYYGYAVVKFPDNSIDTLGGMHLPEKHGNPYHIGNTYCK